MRWFLSIILLVSTTISVAAQTIEAVHLPNPSYYFRTSIIPQIPSSPMGIIVVDYFCTSVQLNGGKALVSSYTRSPGVGAKQVLDLGIDNVSNVGGVKTGNHLHFSVNGGPDNPTQVLNAFSDTLIPCDHAWNQIAITWNSAIYNRLNGQYEVRGYVAGANTPMTILTWNSIFTGGGLNPQQFTTPYRYDNFYNSWAVGARNVMQTPSDFWDDDLSRVFIDINTADYFAMQNVRPISGFGATHPVTGKFLPLRWGPNCIGPLHDFPTICLVGGLGASGFRFNGGQTFTVPQGYLAPTPAQNDIWDGYQ